MLSPANKLTYPPKEIENRVFFPVALELGLDQETSKFVVTPGTLSDCLNYNGTTRGYERGQGLLFYDGTTDVAINNMWFLGVDDDESVLTGDGFTLGGGITWGDGATGRVAYYERVASSPDYTMLGIVEILGDVPVEGDTITDTENGTTWALTGPLTYPTVELVEARNPETGDLIAATITDYLAFLNDTVNRNLVSQTHVVEGDTFNTYHGEIPGTGAITGGWQFEDEVYVVRDSYAVNFDFGTQELVPGDDVLVDLDDATTEQVCVAVVVLTSGDWASGTAAGSVVFKPSADTEDFRSLANLDLSTGYIQTLGNQDIARMLSTPAPTKGLVWKGTVHGWSWVDTGWTIEYGTGTNAPNVRAAPLFVPDLVEAARVTASIPVGAGTSVGDAPYTAWTDPGNIVSDNNSNATNATATGEITQYLKCPIPASTLPQDDIKIIGITVTIKALYTGANALIDRDIRLVNEASGAEFYMSANRARREALPVGETAIVYGGSSDTWGVENISAEDLNDGNMSIWLQYANTSAGSGTAAIDYVSFTIDYVPNTEKVWFRDSADVTTGVVHAFQIESGDFGADDDAIGSMSFMDIEDPTAIGVGMSMYSQSSGGGVFIAEVTSSPQYNVLPSSAELQELGSKYNTITQNYYENDESEAVYGANGAGPAFAFDGESFAQLRTPLARSVDKPRHVAFHDNKLALGFSTGHVVLSAVGTPNNFQGVDSASSWGVGDRVTGLISLPGNVLGVFSEASIRTIEGSGSEDGILRTVSSSTGCKEYTLQNIIGPYFTDNRGVSSLATSDKYGDFDLERVSDPVRVWIQDRIQNSAGLGTLDRRPIHSIAVRNKNQYRLYFADGYVLVLYFRADGRIAPTIMHYDTDTFGTRYVPTFLNSTVLSSGKERIVMGTESGEVWIVDGGEAIHAPDETLYPDCYIVINPINLGKPEAAHKFYHVEVQGQFYGAQTVDAWADGNYVFEATGEPHHTITIGDYDNEPIFVSKNEIDSIYMPELTDGYSVKLQTTMDGSRPHTFQAMLYRVSSKSVDRNRVSKTY